MTRLYQKGALIGVGITSLGYLFITINDAITKSLIEHVPLLQTVAIRTMAAATVMAITMPFFGGVSAIKPRSWTINLFCGALMTTNLVLFPFSLLYMPLTTSLMLVYLSPVLVVLLAPILLKESLGLGHLLGVALGCGGAWLVMSPDLGNIKIAYLLPLTCAFFASLRDIVLRKVAFSEHPLTISAFAYVMTCAVCLTWSLHEGWVPVETRDILMLCVSGFCLAVGQSLNVYAFKFALAPIISAAKYSALVYSIVISAAVWSIFPQASEIVGAALIVLSGAMLVVARARPVPLAEVIDPGEESLRNDPK